MEFTVDREDYERFEKFTSQHHLTPSEALGAVLLRGVSRYWPQQLANMEEDYPELEKRFEEYSRDNDTLRKMYYQNIELTKLLHGSKEVEKTK